jgi:putative hemolysin
VIGTYRLLRQTVADANRGFYSAGEYDLRKPAAPLPGCALSGAGQLLELGRSCVAREHRNAATIGLLWRGIASYLEQHKILFMFGCASFPGTDPWRACRRSFLSCPPPSRARAAACARLAGPACADGMAAA